MIIVVSLLYFVILNALLLITCYFSLKIVKNTIGKNIKYQFNGTLVHKVFWFAVLSYVLVFILVFFFSYFDAISYYGASHLFDASLFFLFCLISCIAQQPYNEATGYTDQIWLYLSILVLSTFIVSVIFNYFIVSKDLVLKKSKRFCAALIVSAMTAPYFYFVPFGELLYY